jgi:hypothetical protein
MDSDRKSVRTIPEDSLPFEARVPIYASCENDQAANAAKMFRSPGRLKDLQTLGSFAI